MKANLPKLTAPTLRALKSAGIENLYDISTFSEKEIIALHGIGKNAFDTLQRAMAESGIKFRN